MTTVLIDSPFANIRNVGNALVACGSRIVLTRDADVIASSTRVVLPGVGSFAAAMQWLDSSGVSGALLQAVQRGTWVLGVCVGHQLLFESSDEGGRSRGLGLLQGRVERLPELLPVPQVGWNRVYPLPGEAMFRGIAEGESFYFVNSYCVRHAEGEIGWSQYGERFSAAVRRGRVFGVQFHPERSSAAGLQLLRNFLEVSS